MEEERIVNGTVDEAAEVVESSGVDILDVAKKFGPVTAALGVAVGVGVVGKKLLNKAGVQFRSPVVRRKKTEAVEPEMGDSEAEG